MRDAQHAARSSLSEAATAAEETAAEKAGAEKAGAEKAGAAMRMRLSSASKACSGISDGFAVLPNSARWLALPFSR